MGKLSKFLKRAVSAPKKIFKNIKKPFSKITKGIARGIAKMGKAVMRGISKISNKLGPLGMIGLAIAMPYALQGLGGMIGSPAMSGIHPATGWMASDNIFLKAVGTVGNSIRTAFSPTGSIGGTWNTITRTVGNTFKKFSGGTGSKGNIWTRISNGAKRLYTRAKATVKQFMPKFKGAQSGTVQVYGDFGEVITMSAEEAQKRILAGQTLDLGGQTLGSVDAGWFTKGQTVGQMDANSLVTETINSALQPQIDMLDGTAKRVFNDHVTRQKAMHSFVNYDSALDATYNSGGITRNFATDFSTEPTSYGMDLSKNKDYKLGGGSPNEPTTYTFTGDDTYNSKIAKNSAKTKKSSSILKKAATSYLAKQSLLSPNVPIVEPFYAMQDMTLDTQGVSYGGTDITGSYGGSLLEGVFDKNKQERIMSFYKNMNILGSS